MFFLFLPYIILHSFFFFKDKTINIPPPPKPSLRNYTLFSLMSLFEGIFKDIHFLFISYISLLISYSSIIHLYGSFSLWVKEADCSGKRRNLCYDSELHIQSPRLVVSLCTSIFTSKLKTFVLFKRYLFFPRNILY